MTVLTRTPENVNFLSPQSGFKFIIKRLPKVVFFTQRINLPGIMTSAPTTSNPFTQIPYAGDHLQWEPLEVTFKVDEDMANYKELHNWLVGTTSPLNFNQYKTLSDKAPSSGEAVYSDISLIIMSNAKGNALNTITFADCIPTSLSGLQLSTDESDIQYLEAMASFAYTYYTFDS